ALTGTALFLCACSGGNAAADGSSSEQGQRIFPVAAAVVEARDLARTVTVSGPVEPIRTIGVNAQMAGTVLRVHAEEGDRVGAGRLLAELDAREIQAQLERGRAVLATREAAFERAKQLVTAQIITEAEYEEANAAYAVAKGDVELWETRLDFSRIRAPSAGIVTLKHVEAGSAVAPNQRLFDLADVSLLVVNVQLSELDVVHVRPRQAVRVVLDAYPQVPFSGRVRRVFPSADPQSRLVPVEIALDAPPPRVDVRPGFLARTTFALDTRAGVAAVPTSAVSVSEQESFVYVIEADTLVRRPVDIGLTSSGWIEVTTGLALGERVVASGQASLRPGARVRVTEEIGSGVRGGS
ncbi:MAG: efflux RND transporter periplasmic adaptor subunit, partial [Gemmatimonadota bacterium]